MRYLMLSRLQSLKVTKSVKSAGREKMLKQKVAGSKLSAKSVETTDFRNLKPKYVIDLEKDDHPFHMIIRAGSILAAKGLRQEAKNLYQEAAVNGYDFYKVLVLLKKYFEI